MEIVLETVDRRDEKQLQCQTSLEENRLRRFRAIRKKSQNKKDKKSACRDLKRQEIKKIPMIRVLICFYKWYTRTEGGVLIEFELKKKPVRTFQKVNETQVI